MELENTGTTLGNATTQESPEGAPTPQSTDGSGLPVAETEKPKTFSRDEVNRMVAAEQAKARQAAIAEVKRQQEEEQRRHSEAELFSKLQEEDKIKALQEKLDAAEQEKQEMRRDHEAVQLKQLAVDKAAKAKLPLSFINDLNYRDVSAESLDMMIETRLKDFNAAVEARLNEKLRQAPPETHKKAAKDDADLRKKFGLPPVGRR